MNQEYARVSVEMPENDKKKSETYQIASDIQWEDAGDGVVRQIMAYDDNLMMVKVKCEQGAVGEPSAPSINIHIPKVHTWPVDVSRSLSATKRRLSKLAMVIM